ncbi:ABC transporter substrate-binding protein [Pseudomonas sp. Marseille-P9899]|uniref:ABC transporter substrate-binding protein n=1 Tax=Pseudomonas sp. Marseille-P9899 TaxID=2730401 RepID=UPI001589FAE1|nr:ABC transporter substrate-binding protein [Pseudomonas sp. Marseille-P9899]
MRALLALLIALALPAQADSHVDIALNGDVNTFDPHMSATIATDLSVASHLYNALILRGPDLRLQPSLALRWRNLEPTRWEFDLAPQARFANGEPLDAEAVVWNLNRVRDPATKSRIAPWFRQIASAHAEGPHTLVIVTDGAFPTLPAQLSMLFMLPPRWTASHDPAREVMPSGPYRIGSRQQGDVLTLVRNEQSWQSRPAFDQVRLHSLPDASARVSALLAGEVDWINAIPLSEVRRIQGSGRALAGVSAPGTRSVFIKLNTLRPPLNDVRVRQALNYAIDKQGMTSALFDGQAAVSACQLLTPVYFGYNADLRAYPYDPAKARRLLAESGVAPGTRLRLEVPANTYLQGDEVTQVIASQLQAVGLDIELVQYDFSTWINRYLKAQKLGDMALLAYAWPSLDADGVLSLLQSDSIYAYYRDAKLDRLLAAGRSVLDEPTRRATYQEATAHLCEQAPVLYLYEQPFTYGASPRIQWQARSDDWIRAYDMQPAAAAKPADSGS